MIRCDRSGAGAINIGQGRWVRLRWRRVEEDGWWRDWTSSVSVVRSGSDTVIVLLHTATILDSRLLLHD